MIKQFLYSLAGGLLSLLLFGLGSLISRRFAPACLRENLAGLDLEAAKLLFDKAERRECIAVPVIAGLLTFPLAHLLHFVNVTVFSPAINPAYDGRRWEWWLLAALLIALAASLPASLAFIRWSLGQDFSTVEYYASLREGIDPKRDMILWSLILLALAIPASWAAWNNGIVIDELGVRCRLAWFKSDQAYDEVQTIETTDVPAAQGAGARRVLRIHFRTGLPVSLSANMSHAWGRPERGLTLADLPRIEGYIRERMPDVSESRSAGTKSP